MKVSVPKKLTDFRWLNLFSVAWQNRGQQGEWLFASRKRNPRPTAGPLTPDAVVVVPVHVSPQGRRLVVLKEFRIPLGDWEHAFPAGLFDAEEGPEACARRELAEETGLILDRVTHVSPPMISSAGLSDESVVMVFCECHGDISSAGREATEDIEVKLLNYEEVCKLSTSTEVKISAKTWPILYMVQLHGEI